VHPYRELRDTVIAGRQVDVHIAALIWQQSCSRRPTAQYTCLKVCEKFVWLACVLAEHAAVVEQESDLMSPGWSLARQQVLTPAVESLRTANAASSVSTADCITNAINR
jgi:hypothetical protein